MLGVRLKAEQYEIMMLPKDPNKGHANMQSEGRKATHRTIVRSWEFADMENRGGMCL